MEFQELAQAARAYQPTEADHLILARGALLVALSLLEETPPKLAAARAVAGEAIEHLRKIGSC